ncbi:MAG: response regulator [Ktedonobacterales bacterium]|nr:response regulator [Ktedonobacterales bacterium]
MTIQDDGQVLIVDDDPDIRHAVRSVLEEEGYHVQEAPDGAKGLRLLAHSHASMVALVDYRMPTMDGYEMLQKVTHDGADLQRHSYVLFTANRDLISPAFLKLLASHHIEIVEKPFNIDALLGTIEHAQEQLAPQA